MATNTAADDKLKPDRALARSKNNSAKLVMRLAIMSRARIFRWFPRLAGLDIALAWAPAARRWSRSTAGVSGKTR